MCDVTKANFEELLPTLKQLLKKADFVCIDTEFTSLVSDEQNRASLFDDGRARYDKLRCTASQSLPCQVGIAIFTSESTVNKNQYQAYAYNFYLMPRAFGPVDTRFILQSSSVQFLCRHDFDFNKVFYNGISYLNKEDETRLLTHIRNNDHFEGLDREEDENVIQDLFNKVVDWHVRETKENLILDIPNGCVSYVIVEEIRQRFPDVWACMSGGKVVVQKADETKRAKLKQEEVDSGVNQRRIFVDDMLGFTRLFMEIKNSRKPVVGHNLFMDLILFHDKFWKNLPVRFRDFKSAITKLFPNIYDTKHIGATMRKDLEVLGVRGGSGLSTLHGGLTSQKAVQYRMFAPHVSFAPGHEHYVQDGRAHEAGYDAYMAGVVFLHLCHHYCMQDVTASQAMKMGFKEYLADMTKFVNHVNLIRGTVNYVNLVGADPPSARPAWLVVTSKQGEPVNPALLARAFAAFGSVDIKRESSTRAYVAVGNKFCAKDILRASKNEEFYSVRWYSMWKHSKTLRRCLWVGLAVGGGICLYTIYSASSSDT